MKTLRVLGATQLATYLAAFVAIAWPRTQEWETFHWGDGFKEVIVMMFAAGGATLIPSSIAFLNLGNKLTVAKLNTGMLLQKTLFIACCFAILPIMYIAQSRMFEYTAIELAVVAGLAFYPIMLAIAKKARKAISQEKSGLD